MKIGIDFKEPSTLRGIVWGIVSILGTIAYFTGRDIAPIILLGTTVVSGLGIGLKDNGKQTRKI